MKRHAALIGLSREHHRALVLARKLCRLESEDATSAQTTQQIADEVLNMWQTEIRAHFQEEEEVLLPMIARHIRPSNQPCVKQMLDDHAWLRVAVWDIEAHLSDRTLVELLRRFGERLRAHVRLEEQEVFEFIQTICSEEDLTEMSLRLRPSHV